MYAWNRIAKILIPTWVFVSMAYIFYFREEPLQYGYLLLMALCLFNGPGLNVNGIGASWYVFMCMWLYFLTPYFCRYINDYTDRHKEAEFKALAKLLMLVCAVGAGLRLCIFFLKLDWYNWAYANPVACADMFIAGVIACKMTSYLPAIDTAKLKLCKRIAIALFVFSGIVFTVKYPNIHGLISYGYAYLGASWYLLLTTAILLLYSYNDTSGAKRFNWWVRLCNTICPYTFTFYLWHSLILMSMVPKFTIDNHFLQYLSVMATAFVLTAYVAYITTKMNHGISKTLLSLKFQ